MICFAVGDNSPRPKKKSEIRTLLDATTIVADNNKPHWMIFQSHAQQQSSGASAAAAAAAGIDNPAFESESAKGDGAGSVLPWKREDHEVQVHTMQDQRNPAYISYKETQSSPGSSGSESDGGKRKAIIGYFQKRDSLTFLGDLDNLDSRSSARRNSKEGTDLLSVLAHPVNIRKTSAPPLNRQISLSSMKVGHTVGISDTRVHLTLLYISAF